jgi:hypothetical protein
MRWQVLRQRQFCRQRCACSSPIQLKGRLLAVHLLNASDDHDVDRRVVSCETEYFVSDGIPGKARDGVVFQLTRLVTHQHTGNRSEYIAFTTDK